MQFERHLLEATFEIAFSQWDLDQGGWLCFIGLLFSDWDEFLLWQHTIELFEFLFVIWELNVEVNLLVGPLEVLVKLLEQV